MSLSITSHTGHRAHGTPGALVVIDPAHGHDGFLIEMDAVGPLVVRTL